MIKRLTIAATALTLMGLVLPVSAQDLSFSMDPVLSCLAENETAVDRLSCAGMAAGACMENTPGGYSTVVMGGCLDREYTVWDGWLNDAYGKAMETARAADADMGGLDVLKQADALRTMQRAWITFRDAKCDFERAQWGGGTGGGPAFMNCLLIETAEQAIYLDNMADMH